jgi:integrase
MARTVRDTNLETRTARLRLRVRAEPYWRSLEKGFFLGYRRRTSGGTWLGRRRLANGGYAEHRISTADDLQDAEGIAVLDYGQAQKAARAWWRADLRREEGHDTRQGPLTVADAVADYLKAYERRGGKAVYETQRAAETHILPGLGTMPVGKLTAYKIADWHHGLSEKRPRTRTKPGRKQNYREAKTGPDAVRKRRATANRILTVLKAALNHAWKAGHVASDDAWRRVKPFKAVETARIRYLSEAECVRLVNACEPAFRNLVRGAMLTGCRYSELASMQVSDFNADAGVVTMRDSKAGKPRHVVLTDEGQQLFAGFTAGKLGSDPIFGRANGGVWGKSHQSRPMLEACHRAKIKPEISFHVLRHTHGSTLAMKGVPMGVIAAQLGHADTRMTEKHYAHLAPSYVADTIRAHFPTLGIAGDTNIAPIKPKKHGTRQT